MRVNSRVRPALRTKHGAGDVEEDGERWESKWVRVQQLPCNNASEYRPSVITFFSRSPPSITPSPPPFSFQTSASLQQLARTARTPFSLYISLNYSRPVQINMQICITWSGEKYLIPIHLTFLNFLVYSN